MIRAAPYDDNHGFRIMSVLDPHDYMEAALVRGGQTTQYSLFADWRAMQAHALRSWVLFTERADTVGRYPFAVCMIGQTGQAGVAQAALLSRDHGQFRVALARLAVTARRSLPGIAAEIGVRRIEARSWAGHPTAARLLGAIGFHHECDMPGFGPGGAVTFRQFAWIDPSPTRPQE